jgi:hypothetical protein
MATAASVATGSRRRVLENVPDVMRSDEEDALKDEHGEELTGMYAPGCASLDQAKLTEEQAQAQRAAVPSQEQRVPPRSQSPAYNSSDDDTLDGPEHIWSQTKGIYRKNKAWTKRMAQMAMALPAPALASQSTPLTSPPKPDDRGKSADQRRQAAPKPVPGAKAPKPTKGQESPGTKVPKPMETRGKSASRAGSLRSGGGSGQTDTHVSQGNPSKT